MSSFNIVNIGDGTAVDLGEHLAGGWGPARLLELDSGDSHHLDASAGEVCAFVIDGSGTVAMGDSVARMDIGTAVTLVMGSAAVVTAETPMQLFAAWLTT
ncbi:MAG: hypothetical protein R6U94_12535 [Nitriliruptoraceae bacterium]